MKEWKKIGHYHANGRYTNYKTRNPFRYSRLTIIGSGNSAKQGTVQFLSSMISGLGLELRTLGQNAGDSVVAQSNRGTPI